ncbi:TIGR03943 family putative permease subunit [Streptomyces sp. NPDC058374]|uniref:TIGR03943 family putative permease subunit n=1 Tax=Streptomyces sp. NPDC058374 TaxID=3346466 RepID=UPI003658A933
MRPPLQSALLLLISAGLLRVSLFSDISLRYVKEGLQPFLVASGFILLATGLLGVITSGLFSLGHGLPHAGRKRAVSRRGDVPPPPASEDGHDHSRGPRVAWLMFPPAVALLLLAPPALGSYTAARDTEVVVATYERFPPLSAAGPAPLSLTEFIGRAQQDKKGGLEGRSVVMQGFVTPRGDGTWVLTRHLIARCAADSQSLKVTVRGVPAPREDSWVRVTGTWHPAGRLGTPTAALAVDATTIHTIPEPPLPYTDRPPEGAG